MGAGTHCILLLALIRGRCMVAIVRKFKYVSVLVKTDWLAINTCKLISR